VAAADLSPGDVVLDVGCGTGLTFEYLEERVGPTGRVIGIDVSPEMLAKARQRAEDHGWSNVALIESPADQAATPAPADAAVFVLTHDLMRSPSAVRHVLGHLKPGGRVVAAGARQPRWARPAGVLIRAAVSRYTTTTEGLGRPWSYLADLAPGLQVDLMALGTAYVVWAALPDRATEGTSA
jgi:ubiquinone/menaquinone biosynthesis C-methylase UbiE